MFRCLPSSGGRGGGEEEPGEPLLSSPAPQPGLLSAACLCQAPQASTENMYNFFCVRENVLATE